MVPPPQLKQILFILGTKGIIPWWFRFSMLELGRGCGVSSDKPWLVLGGGGSGFFEAVSGYSLPPFKENNSSRISFPRGIWKPKLSLNLIKIKA